MSSGHEETDITAGDPIERLLGCLGSTCKESDAELGVAMLRFQGSGAAERSALLDPKAEPWVPPAASWQWRPSFDRRAQAASMVEGAAQAMQAVTRTALTHEVGWRSRGCILTVRIGMEDLHQAEFLLAAARSEVLNATTGSLHLHLAKRQLRPCKGLQTGFSFLLSIMADKRDTCWDHMESQCPREGWCRWSHDALRQRMHVRLLPYTVLQ